MTALWNRLEKNWRNIIGDEFDYVAIDQFLQKERAKGDVYPKDEEIFNALNLTPFEKVKVVIIGQDPYPGKGQQAHGLCFSTKGKKIPPSLHNIYKEIKRDCGVEMPRRGDLTKWAEQGVLLLNATLTVRKDKAGSHRRKGKGWEKFTDAIVRAVKEKPEPVVFLLWGRNAQEVWDRCAQKEGAPIDKKHKVLKASHPAPRSVHRFLRDGDGEIHSFRGCGHFEEANKYLKKHGRQPIDWHNLDF